MGIFEKNKQGLEETIDDENEVYEKLREAEREAESTTKRLTHEEVMEAAWTRILVAERNRGCKQPSTEGKTVLGCV